MGATTLKSRSSRFVGSRAMGRGSSRLLQPAPTVFLELEVLSARGLADEAAGRCSGALRELGMTMNPCVQVFVQGKQSRDPGSTSQAGQCPISRASLLSRRS